jgi:hypothetical protein
MTHSARPIFVIGSLRSGASLLTWSLGQHPNILPLMDNSWLEPFAAGIEEAYAAAVRKRATSQLDIMGIEIEDFYEHFGEAVNRLLLSGAQPGRADHEGDDDAGLDPVPSVGRDVVGGTKRWIDGSPSNCFNVVGLRRLFPKAKFVHVLRDAAAVVDALTNEEKRLSYRSHWQQFTEETAYKHWLETVEACVQAERAFGSATVLRVRRDDLMDSPEVTLCRCLDFIGEPFAPACLRPFR